MNTTAAGRLALACLLAALAVLAALLFTISRYGTAVAEHDVALEERANEVLVERAIGSFRRERAAVEAYVRVPDPAPLAELTAGAQGFRAALEQLKLGNAQERRLVDLALAAHGAAGRYFQEVVRPAAGTPRLGAVLESFDAQEARVIGPLESLGARVDQHAGEAKAVADAGRKRAKLGGIIALVLALAAIAALGIYAVRLLQRVAERERGLERSNDELAERERRLNEVLDRVRDGSRVLSEVSYEMRAASEEAAAATVEQSSAVAETSATIEELAVTASSIDVLPAGVDRSGRDVL